METLWQNGLYAVRSLRKRPGFSGVVILTLALGIGANTAIFSFVNGVLLRPLPYHEPERLVRIHSVRGGEPGRLSQPELAEISTQVSSFASVAAYGSGAWYNISEGNAPPEEAPATLGSSRLFSVLGVATLHGQIWPQEFDRGEHYGVVLNHSFWQRRFGGDPNIIGKKITLDAAPFYTVYGVLPADVNFPDRVDFFRCLGVTASGWDWKRRNVFGLARLKDGVSYAQAQAELDAFSQRLTEQQPEANRGVTLALTPLKDFYVGDVRPYLWLLAGVVGFVLLIACVNVVNLLLARALERERELAVRAALGAGRGRLVRLLLSESLLLAGLGGVIGLALAHPAVMLLKRLVQSQLPTWIEIGIDTRVLLFTFAVTLLAGLLAGLLPAWQAARPNLNETLKEGGRSGTGHPRLRQALVVTEIALALALLVGAGLLVRSYWRLQQTPLGFRADNLLTLRVALPWKKYDANPPILNFYRQALTQLSSVPGVEAVAACSNPPLSGRTGDYKVTLAPEGQSPDEQTRNPYVNRMRVSPSYFQMMGVPLLKGRVFDEADTEEKERVAVISQRLAERLWPGQEAPGKRLQLSGPGSQQPLLTVVGVAGNVQHDQLTSEVGYDLYVSFYQMPDPNQYLLVRANLPPAALTAAVNRAIRSVDADQSTFDFATMDERIAASVWQRRLTGWLLVAFAGLALTLAAIGIYGVTAYAVRQRTREFGIRLALGANARDVLRLVIGQGLRLALTGIGIGLLAALGLTRLLNRFLFGVNATDPLTFASVASLLVLVTLLACWLPARRAAQVDPMTTLRGE